MKDAGPPAADPALTRALLRPASVALIGASTNPTKNTGRPLRYLRQHGFRGRIAPINPNADEIDGVPAFASLADVPFEIDAAFILVGAGSVLAAVEACVAKGVRCATILSEGFGEAGPEGRAREAAVVAAARAGGLRLLGPNSIGVVDTATGFACSANAALEMPVLPEGGYGVISQSGSMIGALLSHGAERRIGFSSVVSVGNEADLTVGEIGEAMIADPRCRAILLFLEAIRDRAALARMARAAEAAGKPVLAYKLGRSEEGRALAASHTGALSGDDAVSDALLAHLGIARVRMLETLYEAPPLFIGSGAPAGRRVAVVTTTGGGGAMVVDALASNGLEIAAGLPEVRAVLEADGISGGHGGLIDLTLAGTRPELVRAVLDVLTASDAVDAVVMVIGSSSQFHPDLAVSPLRGFAGSPKPLAVYLVPAATRSREMLAEEGLAVFRTPESCAEGVRARLCRRAPATDIAAPRETVAAVEAVLADADAGALDEVASRRVCDALGIGGPEGVLATSEQEARAAFARLGGPVVMKIVSPDIPHKSDRGGIVLNVESGDAAAELFARLMASQAAAYPEADLKGVLVQRMARGLGEAIIGFRRDPAMGPVIMVGAGGVQAELLADTALRVAPVDVAIAREMVGEVRSFGAYGGFRDLPRGDLDALARAVASLSLLAQCPGVAEAEINPALVRSEGQGVLALDALVLRTEQR